MTDLTLDGPWLGFDLGQPMEALSWSINRPGFVQTSHILWREVRNADLLQDIDVCRWLEKESKRQNSEDAGRDWGTINVAVRVDAGLSQTGLLEAMSIAVQARTAAVMDARFDLPTGIATGTDCVAIAGLAGSTDFAGLHTDIVGPVQCCSVYDAVSVGAGAWKMELKETRHA
ncbi:adenosylcobinamide amidohydrolase [uncultured Ruegeria sp.]|uniref:adenosylcobinamide amidohydrolase n=1 Tax=uncultured Ruegeria sp. TaxID=259304 RepID=UPI002634AB24|nr:adenosylcobinamide amidohydrolase [uncultured Ruegeria sp.]